MKVAFLVADMFEQAELEQPLHAVREQGWTPELVSLEEGEVRAFEHFEPADSFPVDTTVEEACADDHEALVLPGGVGNPDQLRGDEKAVAFVRAFFEHGKPVAAIRHAPWTLVEAAVVLDRTLTSWPTLRTDIPNAGGNWVDEEVHVDNGLVTSRKPDDLPAFCAKLVEAFREGPHAGQRAGAGEAVPT